jgi:phage/plasmid-like protein (TIGR03299 family)
MAHEIETMMYVNETPWHGLGTKLNAPPSIEEAIRCAGLDWNVDLARLQTADGQTAPAFATRRTSDGKILGVVGPDYRVLQNSKAFAFFDPFVKSSEALIETAGSLRQGSRVWVLARINREPSIIVRKADDVVQKYILLSNSHDGTMAVRVGFTPIRVVCANTLAMAHGDSASKLVRVRHTAKAETSLEALRDVMNLANQQFEATAEQYRRLAEVDINSADLAKYVCRVFSPTLADSDDEDVMKKAETSRVLASVTNLFENGRGNNMPGVRGTLWAAYNAVTEYMSYERGGDRDVRLDRLWFQSGVTTNRRALETAMKLAA